MKKIIRKAALILVFVMVSCFSFSVSADEDFNDMGNRAISDVNKVWTLKFRTPVDVSSLNNNISMQDLTDGSTVSVNIVAGDDQNSAKINPPSGGYKMSHNYKLTIGKSVQSKKGENLPKSAVLKFNLTSKDNNNYNASASVVVSPVLPILKQITISTTNLPSASKYKIEGNNKFFNIGSAATSIVTQSTAQIYLYDNKGNLLGTFILNTNSNTNNTSMNITLAN